MEFLNKFFLLDTKTVKEYLIYKKYFEKNDEIVSKEIGDGNINYVFLVKNNEKSIVVKQADEFLRANGRPLDSYRSKIEYNILKEEERLAPGFVPKIYEYDDIMHTIIMEDISEYKNLRYELMSGKKFEHFSENISTFLADSLLPTTDLVLDSMDKKEKVKKYINKELCLISENLVLTEPYYDYKSQNRFNKENLDFVTKKLYENDKLKFEVSKLRNNFMNNAQALIHGDLHSGSIFVNEKGIKIIDPEFAFYGPIGYDIGNVIANLFFPLICFENCSWLKETIIKIFDKTFEKMSVKYDEIVKLPLYKVKEFKEYYLNEIMADTCGYAGTEIIRRTIGDTHVKELDNISAEKEQEFVNLGIKLIMNRYSIKEGKDLF